MLNKCGSELIRSHDQYITNLRFKPLRYNSPCRLYDTLELYKNIQLLIIVRTNTTENDSKINMSCAFTV